LYPQQYQEMVALCREKNEPLADRERRVFPVAHGEIMGRLLKAWNIPPAICAPLKYITHSYMSLARLSDPMRTKAELLKLGVLIGRIAVGEWEPWDRIEFPPAPVLQRLGWDSFSEIVQATKADSEGIISFRSEFMAPTNKPGNREKHEQRSSCLAYCNLSADPFDFLAEVASSMGIVLQPRDADAIEPDENVLINCIWVPPYKLAARVSPGVGGGAKLIVTDAEQLEPYSRFGQVLSLPGSHGALRQACEEVARVSTSMSPAGTTPVVIGGSVDAEGQK